MATDAPTGVVPRGIGIGQGGVTADATVARRRMLALMADARMIAATIAADRLSSSWGPPRDPLGGRGTAPPA